MGKLSLEEKETHIYFNEADSTAAIDTFNVKMINALDKLCGERPDEVSLTAERPDGSFSYICPKRWFNRPRPPRQMNEEQRKTISDRMKAVKAPKIPLEASTLVKRSEET